MNRVIVNSQIRNSPGIVLNNATVDRLLAFLSEHPERSDYLSHKVDQSINDILTIDEYAVKVNQFCHHQGRQS